MPFLERTLNPTGKPGFPDNTQQRCFKACTSLASSQQEKCPSQTIYSFHGELYSTAVTHLCVGLTQHVQKLMEFHHQRTRPQLFLAVFTHFYYQAGINKKMEKK